MPRQPRESSGTGIYHVMMRGINHQNVFEDKGDTELLFATGALELDTIETNGGSNKYKLSRLGAALLRWGFGIHLELEHGKGTNVDVPTMTPDEVEEIVKGNVEKAVPKVVNDALQWE